MGWEELGVIARVQRASEWMAGSTSAVPRSAAPVDRGVATGRRGTSAEQGTRLSIGGAGASTIAHGSICRSFSQADRIPRTGRSGT